MVATKTFELPFFRISIGDDFSGELPNYRKNPEICKVFVLLIVITDNW